MGNPQWSSLVKNNHVQALEQALTFDLGVKEILICYSILSA